MTIRSDVKVPRPVRTHGYTGLVFILAGAFCLWCASPPAFAAGCHVADRPVLKSTLSWERDPNFHVVTPPLVQAPPVLSHPPCQGEIPHVLESSLVTNGAACLDRSLVEPPPLSEPIQGRPRREHRQPPALRLHRPPRPIIFGVTMELPA
jgi:hypothetical protein